MKEQGQQAPSCHPGWENMKYMENMETMEKIEASTRWLKTLYFLFKHQNILFVTQNTLFGNRMTKTLYLIAVMSTVEKS